MYIILLGFIKSSQYKKKERDGAVDNAHSFSYLKENVFGQISILVGCFQLSFCILGILR